MSYHKSIKPFTTHVPTWCPGCGDWAINSAIKRSFVNIGYTPSDVCVVFGIGCSGNMNDHLNAYAFHALHGRSIPVALGVKLANHDLPVLVVAGDGDTYGEGGNHLLHASRGNHDITVIIHDNSVYGLTTGQVAPTALHGMRAKSTPTGMIERSISPLALLVSQGATFVAQTFAGYLDHASEMVEAAMRHKGFSVVNVLQPCVTFNRVNTYQYYLEKSYYLGKEHNPKDKQSAMKAALEMDNERYALGIVYEDKDAPVYHEQVPTFDGGALVSQTPKRPIDVLTEEFLA